MALNGLFGADVLQPLDLVPLTDFTYKYHPARNSSFVVALPRLHEFRYFLLLYLATMRDLASLVIQPANREIRKCFLIPINFSRFRATGEAIVSTQRKKMYTENLQHKNTHIKM